MPDPTCPRFWSCWNQTPKALPFFCVPPLRKSPRSGEERPLGYSPGHLPHCRGGRRSGGPGIHPGLGQAMGSAGRGGSREAQAPPALSTASSSSAWPRPRLPRNTSSASTGNRCRGVTPRAETSRGRAPLPPQPPPSTSVENKPAAGLASQSLCARMSLRAHPAPPRKAFPTWATPPFPACQPDRYLRGNCVQALRGEPPPPG